MQDYWKFHFGHTQNLENELYKVHIQNLSTSYHHERLKIDFGPTESMKTVNRSSRIAKNMILGQTGFPE